MLAEMRPSELGEWLALNTISPWSGWRADYMTAQVCAILAEVHRDKKKRSQPFTARDFMVEFLLDSAAADKDLASRIRSAFKSRKR